MTNDIEDLARRAVACPGFRWVERMVDQYENTVLLVVDGAIVECVDRRGNYIDLVRDGRIGEARRLFATSLPDLADLATLGCLEGLVCNAFGVEVYLSPEWHEGQRWWVPRRESNDVACGPGGRTRAHALVAALEAAPAKVAP